MKKKGIPAERRVTQGPAPKKMKGRKGESGGLGKQRRVGQKGRKRCSEERLDEELLNLRLHGEDLRLELRALVRGHRRADDRPRDAARAAKGLLGRHKNVRHVLHQV